MYICDFSRSLGAGRATTRNTRGLTRSVIRLIVPPLPAVSRPSNTMQSLAPDALTHSCMATSSPCRRRSSRSYSLRFSLAGRSAVASHDATEGDAESSTSCFLFLFLAMSLTSRRSRSTHPWVRRPGYRGGLGDKPVHAWISCRRPSPPRPPRPPPPPRGAGRQKSRSMLGSLVAARAHRVARPSVRAWRYQHALPSSEGGDLPRTGKSRLSPSRPNVGGVREPSPGTFTASAVGAVTRAHR